MCGIAGVLWRAPTATATDADVRVSRMLVRERHRGPDDEGVSALHGPDGRVLGAIGSVRLAVLDPTPDGHQPMHDPATGDVLVFNGELFNHREVRRALGDAVPWRSGTDTETLLRAYQRWGPGCLERLRGMFGFALWDARAQALWCARDRLGIKPLYYTEAPAGLAFASEVRALVASGLVGGGLDPDGLRSYVRYGAVSEPATLLQGVRSLEAGDWVRVDGGRIVERRAYWRPAPRLGRPPRRAAAQAAVDEALTRAVEEHLLADVPVATLLSGGVDSSLVTALAARLSPGRITSFTLGFSDPDHDEAPFAAAVARHCRVEHRVVLLEPDEVAARVPDAVAAMDQPSIDGVNTWLISGAVAAAGFKVVLSGLGGDELFGGYPSFRWVPLAERLAPWLGPLPAAARCLAQGGRGARALALLAPGRPIAARYEQVRALWSDGEVAALGVDPGAPLAAWAPGAARGRLAVSLLELSGYMRSTLLRDADAMSMAHSLELRVPLLDHALVERCLDEGAARGGLGPSKAMLVRIAARHLPRGLLERPKRGFALPMDAWMRGPLRGFVAAGLAALARTGIMPEAVRLARRFEARRLPWARLWQFVVLGHWLERRRGDVPAGGGAA